MEIPKEIKLPFQLECFRKQLEPSALSVGLIHPFSRKTSLTESKFAGYPYLPKNRPLPKDLNGNFMNLLAQINFSQLSLDPPFPKQGILQFFISSTPYESTNQIHEQIFQHDFKVRYYPSILPENQLVQDFPLVDMHPKFPIQDEMALTFQNHIEPVSAMDYRLEQFLDIPLLEHQFKSEDGSTLEEFYFERFLGADHKIGGYPYFIETDPRKNSFFLKKFDTLLLQIISNDEHGIMWGDSGIIKFFINRGKLEILDFSDIYFHAEQY